MTPEQFAELAQQPYNRIPVYRDVLADLDTPLSAYLKLARGPYSYLFESVEGGEKWGRYSIIGLRASTVLTVRGNAVLVCEDGREVESLNSDDPLGFIEQFQARYQVPDLDALPEFNGGLVGYFGYDTVRYVEKKLAATCPPDKLGNPDILLMVSDEVVVFDNLAGIITLIVHANPADADVFNKAQQRLDQLEALMAGPAPELARPTTEPGELPESAFESEVGEAGYSAMVERVKEYTLAGDVMQVVPSQRLSTPFNAEPINLYRALRRLNPSPYMFYLDLDDFHIVGSSPEILVRLRDDTVTVRPIAGTRPRGATPDADEALAEELLADPKEQAEHLMLLDLGRNDVGRVSEIGTVEVTEEFTIERYSHVMHIVSNVQGKVKPGTRAVDALAARNILAGVPAARLYGRDAGLGDVLLVAVSELTHDEDMDALCTGLAEVLA